jgi:tetratricopeptide (TPR) repeat protein
MLAAAGDATRLSALARDPRRHAFLLRATGSDYAALAEIGAAQRLVAGRDEPDLQALVELAVYRNAISLRNQCLPFVLPGVWARLGRLDHAAALARVMTHPDARAGALEEVATVAAQAGDADRASRLTAEAEALARSLPDAYSQAYMLAALVSEGAAAGDTDRASRLATEAEAIARTITDPDDQASVLADLAAAIAQAGDLDRAEALARTVTRPEDQAGALTELATAAAEAGDPDRASRLATGAEAMARTITDPDSQQQALTELASAMARTGHLDRARDLLALALSADSPEIIWWIEAVTEYSRTSSQAQGPCF